jgi:hypothetical protein
MPRKNIGIRRILPFNQRHALHDANEALCRDMNTRFVEQLLCRAHATLTPRPSPVQAYEEPSPVQAYEEMRDDARLVGIRHLEQRMRHGDIAGVVPIVETFEHCQRPADSRLA